MGRYFAVFIPVLALLVAGLAWHGTVASNTSAIHVRFADASGADIVLAPFHPGYNDFTLLQAENGAPPFVAPTSYDILPGGSVAFQGRNFLPDESVTILRDGKPFDVVKADAYGDLNTISYYVGYQSGIQDYSFSGAESQNPFSVQVKIEPIKPWLSLSDYYESAGNMILAKGHFFGAFEPITLRFGSKTMGTTFTDEQGNFHLLFRVPGGAAGVKIITSKGGITGGAATTTFSQAE